MATHHVMIDGTSYAVGGGTALVNGTKYQIGGGTTLIDGTAYQINFAEPAALKWVLAAKPNFPSKKLSGTFTAEGSQDTFDAISTEKEISITTDKTILAYWRKGQSTYLSAATWLRITVNWLRAEFRNLTFTEPPTGDMLAWLQENGTPQ